MDNVDGRKGKEKKKKKEYNNGGPKKCWSIERPVLSLWQGGGGKAKERCFLSHGFFFFLIIFLFLLSPNPSF